jgi:hypothetical protein
MFMLNKNRRRDGFEGGRWETSQIKMKRNIAHVVYFCSATIKLN